MREAEEFLRKTQESMKKKYSCDRSITVTRLEDLLQDCLVRDPGTPGDPPTPGVTQLPPVHEPPCSPRVIPPIPEPPCSPWDDPQTRCNPWGHPQTPKQPQR